MLLFFFFFFNDTATTEIYTLSLHDALPILLRGAAAVRRHDARRGAAEPAVLRRGREDRKSTRLNSSHGYISYAVFCLKKKKNTKLVNSFIWYLTATSYSNPSSHLRAPLITK